MACTGARSVPGPGRETVAVVTVHLDLCRRLRGSPVLQRILLGMLWLGPSSWLVCNLQASLIIIVYKHMQSSLRHMHMLQL